MTRTALRGTRHRALAALLATTLMALPAAWRPAAAAEPVAAAAGPASAAADATLWRSDSLRRQPRTTAPVLATLAAGSAVQLRESRPGWWRVDSAAGTGWVRMFSVATPAEAAAGAADRAVAAAAPRAAGHALILGVGRFAAAGIPALPGVGHDLDSAVALARSMGVPPSQTTVLRDEALSLDGMVHAVQQLVARVQPGDRVFVYFSGHGTRYRDAGRPGSPCVSSLLTHDGQPFTDSMLAEALTLLADKTDKLFAFVDACFSGGAAVPARGTVLTPKFFARAGVAAACGQPSNVVTRGLAASGPQRWAGRDNFIYLSAARETEIAFEEAGAGGFATRAVRDCALREARDLDASGSVSLAEITQCAQQRIDRWLSGSRDYLPHHLTLLGNQHFVPNLGAAADAPALPPSTAVRPEGLLRDLHAQRDARRELVVQLARQELSVGRGDRLALSVRAPAAGYLFVLHAGSDGSSIEQLFPNAVDRDNRVAANQWLALPRAGWAMQARGPVGTDRLLVMVSDSPRDFAALAPRSDGVFATLPVTPANVREWLQAVVPAPAAACRGGAPGACPGGFAAALVEVREVP